MVIFMKLNNRKIHIIGINSFEIEDIPTIQKKLFQRINNIAVPKTYIEYIKNWFDKNSSKKCFYPSNSNSELIEWLKSQIDDVILISRGDPLWFGIGRILLENFSKEELHFYPSNTSIQLAFCKLKIPWQDIKCISIHGRDTSELVKALKLKESNLAVITDSKNNNLELIRKNLIEMDIYKDYEFWICEELGFNNEKIRQIKIEEKLPNDISNLNIAVLLKNNLLKSEEELPLFGLNDNCYKTFKDRPNLITKREIRIQILADLEIPEDGILWDIGAGSGTIGLEALKLRPDLKLFSIDKRFGTKKIISENANRLRVYPKEIIEKDINQLLKLDLDKNLLPPNRVVIGGCNKETKINVIRELSKFMQKDDLIVLPIITYEMLKEIKDTFEELNFNVCINLIQTYKSLSIAEGTRFEPNNPVFIIKAKKI